MNEEQACCACLKVIYAPVENDRYMSERWECESCHARFSKHALIDRLEAKITKLEKDLRNASEYRAKVFDVAGIMEEPSWLGLIGMGSLYKKLRHAAEERVRNSGAFDMESVEAHRNLAKAVEEIDSGDALKKEEK